MDANVKVMLENNGFDVEGAMKRFLNNEALYVKCLKKFLDDTSYEELKAAYEAGNCNDAFKAAHTMKGFVSNLGINNIYHLLIPMVEKLRVQDMDVEEDIRQLGVMCEKAVEMIENL